MNKSHFGFEKPEDSLGFLLWQTSILWQRKIKKLLESFDIAHPQFVLMALILWFEEQHYDITQVLLADWSKLDKMTVSQSLKKLTARELVTRIEHATDTRAKSVKLTHKGRLLISKLVPKIEKIDESFFEILPQKEQKRLIGSFKKLIERTRDSNSYVA